MWLVKVSPRGTGFSKTYLAHRWRESIDGPWFRVRSKAIFLNSNFPSTFKAGIRIKYHDSLTKYSLTLNVSRYISYLLHILDNTRYNGMKFICNFKIYGINLLATWSTEARKLLLLLKCRVSSLKYTEPRPVQLLTSTSLEIAGVLCRAKRKSELCHAALSTGRKYNSNFEVILGSRHQIRHR